MTGLVYGGNVTKESVESVIKAVSEGILAKLELWLSAKKKSSVFLVGDQVSFFLSNYFFLLPRQMSNHFLILVE